MLYDHKGNPVGKVERERTCEVLGERFSYRIVPEDEMPLPYAMSKVEYVPFFHLHEGRPRKVLVLKDYQILVSEAVPDSLKDVFAAHEQAHRKNLTHKEIFPIELNAARELGVLDKYMSFSSSRDVLNNVKRFHEYGREDGTPFDELKEAYRAEAWVKLEGDELVDIDF